ncbi:Rossmann-fold NAD(P)-binding domain-containing protein [Chryseobacterium sp. A301]
MKNFTSLADVTNLKELLLHAHQLKKDLYGNSKGGQNKTLGLVFLNPSLRTRLSSQKAAANLGMQVLLVSPGSEAWTWEFKDGEVMNGSSSEHVKEAARVLSEYCDIIGLRSFPGLSDREKDYSEDVFKSFVSYAKVPVISLESATRHPLQSFADLITIQENWKLERAPKVVLSWAPHSKALPQCVPNSFAEWMNAAEVDFSIANPLGYDLSPEFVQGAKVYHDQDEALENADFVYVKNWSSFENYGTMPKVQKNWLLQENFLTKNPQAKVMHCLPVRRNLEMSDALLDSENSLVYQQAFNRTVAMQTVLERILKGTL